VQVIDIQPDHYVYTALRQTQDAPSWGLARLSRDGPIDPADPTDMTHVYDDNADGKGATAYVVDTGVFIEHEVRTLSLCPISISTSHSPAYF
jgi:hypothetical protein